MKTGQSRPSRTHLALLSLLLICGPVAVAVPATAGAAPARPSSASARPSSASAPAPGLRRPAPTPSVHAPALPRRILCLSASATQMLYAIGAGAQVVGVDRYSTWPSKAPRTRLTGGETSAEDYLAYRPDLVILAYNEGTMVQQLAKLHIATLVLPPAPDIAGSYRQLVQLGRATGHTQAAARVIRTLKAYLAAQVRRAHGKGVGRSYYIEFSPQPLYTATSASFVGSEFSLFGMRNIADKAGHGNAYPEISAEYLLSAQPNWVFLADTVCCHVTVANFAKRPGFSVLAAIKDDHVVGLNDSVASQWGPHTIEMLTGLLAKELSS